jgi:TolA-binding protein
MAAHKLIAFVAVLALMGCTVQGAKRSYILAERFWSDGNYADSVREFEKVVKADPKNALGMQALFRAAMTQTLFLDQHTEALEKLKTYLQLTEDPEMSWNARKEVGEILYSKQRKYSEALSWYQELLYQRPRSKDAPELHYRIARCQFFLWKFSDSIQTLKEIESKYPGTTWAEKAAFEIGMTLFTQADDEGGGSSFTAVIQAFEAFTRRYPNSTSVPHAQFWIAASLEELERLDEAYARFEALKAQHPEPHLVEVKLKRIQERRDRARSGK